MSFHDYISIFGGMIVDLLVKHIILFLIALAGATLAGILAGIVVYRSHSARFIVPVMNVLQATPEIVLLALCIPFLGIGYVGALVPLFIKGILPIMQNTLSGLRSVEPGLKEAARGMGMSEGQTLLKVELINAAPAIIAGIRVSAIMLVSVITLTAYIGVESLGTLILQGIARMDTNALLVGSGLSALLAIIVNQIMILLERTAMHLAGRSR